MGLLACLPLLLLLLVYTTHPPDCGLKTRRWSEVIPSLSNMVQAAAIMRNRLAAPAAAPADAANGSKAAASAPRGGCTAGGCCH